MSTLHFVFVPTLYIWMNEDTDEEVNFPTSNYVLNRIIVNNLLKDTTNIKEIAFPLKSLAYKYDPETNLIHLWAYKEDMTEITPCQLTEIIYNYSPANRGPDTWMLQNIDIVTEEQAKRFGYHSIEMVPKLLKIFVEKEVDLNVLPSDDSCPIDRW